MGGRAGTEAATGRDGGGRFGVVAAAVGAGFARGGPGSAATHPDKIDNVANATMPLRCAP
ncbi:MAG: hypothetical protein V4657_06785 [Pseudomonadota bacterium]